mgnify:CR=1 FL=1
MYGSDYMEILPILIILFTYLVLFYFIYKLIFWLKGRRKNNNLSKIAEIYFLCHYFKVDEKKIGIKRLLNTVALCNSIIFTTVLMSTILIDNFLIRFLVMFGLMFPLIYLVYYFASIWLNRKGK